MDVKTLDPAKIYYGRCELDGLVITRERWDMLEELSGVDGIFNAVAIYDQNDFVKALVDRDLIRRNTRGSYYRSEKLRDFMREHEIKVDEALRESYLRAPKDGE